MATATRGRPPRREPRPATPEAPDIPSSDPPMDLLPPAVSQDLVPVVSALIRTIQAAFASAAADLGRGDMGANADLVRLGAHREDVETLRAFLAAQPRPAHIPEEF